MKFYQGNESEIGCTSTRGNIVVLYAIKIPWQIGNVLSRAKTGPVMVCKLHRRQNPFPAKVPRALTTILRLPFGR